MEPLIKNQGAMQTIINNNNNQNEVHQMNWDADYDGKLANISVNLLDNNKLRHYQATLNNNDLEELLNIPSINSPLDKRLINDFKKSSSKKRSPSQARIILPSSTAPAFERPSHAFYTHLSSPEKNEEIIVPLNSELLFKPKTKTKKRRHYIITKYRKKHNTGMRRTRKLSTSKNTRKSTKKSFRM